jgi:hypothetical protein
MMTISIYGFLIRAALTIGLIVLLARQPSPTRPSKGAFHRHANGKSFNNQQSAIPSTFIIRPSYFIIPPSSLFPPPLHRAHICQHRFPNRTDKSLQTEI